MRCKFVIWVLVVLVVAHAGTNAGAEEFSFSYHEASVTGMAHLFDGGDPVFGGDTTDGPDDPIVLGAASDFTQPGSFGATASGGGSSRISIIEDQMLLTVDLSTGYFPSLFPGGDNPGGAAEAELSSIIEFIVPMDDLIWAYDLDIVDTVFFSGSTNVMFENVTQGEVLLELSAPASLEGEILSAHTGDLMRLTTNMFGSGDTEGPQGIRRYDSDFQIGFFIPEPATFAMFFPPAALLLRRRRIM